MQERYCRVCRTKKSLSEFHKDKSSWDGLQPKCKTCNRRLVKESRARKFMKDNNGDSETNI